MDCHRTEDHRYPPIIRISICTTNISNTININSTPTVNNSMNPGIGKTNRSSLSPDFFEPNPGSIIVGNLATETLQFKPNDKGPYFIFVERNMRET